jgi:hypothetical protein
VKKICALLVFAFALSVAIWSNGAWSTDALVADSTLQSGNAGPESAFPGPTSAFPGPTSAFPGPTSAFPGPV